MNTDGYCFYDKIEFDNKDEAQFKKWDEQWAKLCEKKKSQADKEASLNIAQERTRDAQEKQKQIDDLLIYALDIDATVNWDSLKDMKEFTAILLLCTCFRAFSQKAVISTEKSDRIMPIRGFCISAPSHNDLDDFIKFIDEDGKQKYPCPAVQGSGGNESEGTFRDDHGSGAAEAAAHRAGGRGRGGRDVHQTHG
jgi:hypothetical protein